MDDLQNTSDASDASWPPPGLQAGGALKSNQYLLNAMSDGVLALDRDSRIYYANSNATRLLGRSREELRGRGIGDVLTDPLAADVHPEELCQAGLVQGELIATDCARFRRKDGSIFAAMLTAIPVTANDPAIDWLRDSDVLGTTDNPAESKGTPDSAAEAENGSSSPPIAGLLLVFRDTTPGLYLSLGRINQLLTRLMTRQGARSTIETALAGVAEIVAADFAVLGHFDEESDEIVFQSEFRREPDGSGIYGNYGVNGGGGVLRVPAAATPYSYIYHNRAPLCIHHYREHPLAQSVFLERGATSLLATPVLAERRLLGVAYFFRTGESHRFGEADLEHIRALGPVLSAAFFKADHESKLTELATTDALTGLQNRRVIFERLASEVERARRYQDQQTIFSLLLLDLDFFKAINDQHGHATGDRVLMAVSECLRANTRSADCAARTGGEEFLILLPQTNLSGAVRAAEKIRDAIAKLRITPSPNGEAHANEPAATTAPASTVEVTASIGCVQYSGSESLEDLYGRVDTLLYASKDQGRNRISHETSGP